MALRAGTVELVNVESDAVFQPGNDEHEIAMRRKAAAMVREALDEELAGGVGKLDHEFVGRLERRLRMAGAEDLVILLTNGGGPPAPACGRKLEAGYSISIALEYRGHWARLSKTAGSYKLDPILQVHERMDGSYPYECMS
jgi:hypothetical protein